VLIVEDDRLLATLLRLDLERNGYSVLPPVTSEAEALEAAVRYRPDCIVMDVRLGDADGVAAANAIRDVCNAPVVFLTGLPAAEVKQRVSSLERCLVLAKPVPWLVVRAAIDDLLAAVAERAATTVGDNEQSKG